MLMATEDVEEGIAAFMTVPIRSRDRVLGVLDVGTSQRGVIREDQLHLLGAVAHQLGVVFDNAALLIRSQQGERFFRHLLEHAPDLTILCDHGLIDLPGDVTLSARVGTIFAR